MVYGRITEERNKLAVFTNWLPDEKINGWRIHHMLSPCLVDQHNLKSPELCYTEGSFVLIL